MIEVIEPRGEILTEHLCDMEKMLELAGRCCYKSEDRITDNSAAKFIRMICKNQHESVLEHCSITARIVCSRAASHQLVRHRLGAYSQESMRYCNYGKRGLMVICPPSIGIPPGTYDWDGDYGHLKQSQVDWLYMVEMCYAEYQAELDSGVLPEDARFILPNAVKTEIVTTYNLRQWRHVFKVRTDKHAQWEIRNIMTKLLAEMKISLPSVFSDLTLP